MGMTLTYKILSNHLTDGKMVAGEDIGVKIDQTLTQDATGTMAYLEFEAMGIDRVKTEKSVAYIDHNTLQTGFENADDHVYIQSVCKKHGIYYSRPGNGICHQVHLERFGIPGKTLIGSDSHTPTGGGIGMLAFGAGGLDVAVAMGGGAYYITVPKVVNVVLTGTLQPYCAAKDVILELLRRLTVKGGVGNVFEFSGAGVATLSVPERATITNMGAELGATTSVFPSDECTRAFLQMQGRGADYVELYADADAVYDETVNINLNEIKPAAAMPHSPDNVKTISEIGAIKVDQVLIGSCTNSSYRDMQMVAQILKGKHIAENVSLAIAPGSKQVLRMMSENGILSIMLAAGARILETACGPCIGMGLSPTSAGVSLRTFNRNFEGRSGTADAQVYLVSPETAAYSALSGVLSDPSTIKEPIKLDTVNEFLIDDSMVIAPAECAAAKSLTITRGPNIKEFPKSDKLTDQFNCPVLLKVGDNITTDHIMPAGAKILPYRSNIPYLANFCFTACDKDFAERAMQAKGGIIIGGSNYGQGSSREHAALVPLYLGVKAVVAKSFARIHKANLVNAGILPLTFADPADYDKFELNDGISLTNLIDCVQSGKDITITNKNSGITATLICDLSDRQRDMMIAGGLLNYTKQS